MKSSSRNGAKVRLIALHTTEGIMKNTDLLAFFNRPTAQGSSHASADRTGLLEEGFVPYDRAAWTLRSGNPISENLEQCGFASWSRERWLTTELGTIQAAALWIAKRCLANNIPIRYLTHDQLRAGQAGVIQHNDWTVAMKDGTHWDCGPNYPIDVVIAIAQNIAGTESLPTVPPSLPEQLKRVNKVQNIVCPPGNDSIVLVCPVGSRSMIVERAFISAVAKGPGASYVKCFAQSDTGGVHDWEWWINVTDGRSEREIKELQDGVTQIVIQYRFPNGGTICLETISK